MNTSESLTYFSDRWEEQNPNESTFDHPGSIDEWPYPDLDKRWEAGDHSWREVSQEIYTDQLEVVPPVRMKGNAFAVGEIWDYDYTHRCAIYTVFCEVSGRYFGRHATIVNFDPQVYTLEIKAQFHL